MKNKTYIVSVVFKSNKGADYISLPYGCEGKLNFENISRYIESKVNTTSFCILNLQPIALDDSFKSAQAMEAARVADSLVDELKSTALPDSTPSDLDSSIENFLKE